MATDAQVTTAVTAANALVASGTLSDQNMYIILDRAILDAIVKGDGTVSLPIAMTMVDGVTRSQMTLADAIRARDYYRDEVRKNNPPQSLNPEFGGYFGADGQDAAVASY